MQSSLNLPSTATSKVIANKVAAQLLNKQIIEWDSPIGRLIKEREPELVDHVGALAFGNPQVSVTADFLVAQRDGKVDLQQPILARVVFIDQRSGEYLVPRDASQSQLFHSEDWYDDRPDDNKVNPPTYNQFDGPFSEDFRPYKVPYTAEELAEIRQRRDDERGPREPQLQPQLQPLPKRDTRHLMDSCDDGSDEMVGQGNTADHRPRYERFAGATHVIIGEENADLRCRDVFIQASNPKEVLDHLIERIHHEINLADSPGRYEPTQFCHAFDVTLQNALMPIYAGDSVPEHISSSMLAPPHLWEQRFGSSSGNFKFHIQLQHTEFDPQIVLVEGRIAQDEKNGTPFVQAQISSVTEIDTEQNDAEQNDGE